LSVQPGLYAQGRTLRQIGAELGVHWSTVSQQLQRAGITMRSSGPTTHPASTQQILQLREQGLTWHEVAKQVDMTVSGVWSRYRRVRKLRRSLRNAAAGARLIQAEPLESKSAADVAGITTRSPPPDAWWPSA
jgi:hypothetical protein